MMADAMPSVALDAPTAARPLPSVGDSWLKVGDLHTVRRFYEDGLGLIATKIAGGSVRLAFSAEDQCGLRLVLHDGPVEVGKAYGHVAFAVHDAAAAFNRLIGLGAEVLIEPGILAEGGPLCAFVTDPAGYAIELVETTGPRGASGFDSADVILGPRDGAPRMAHTMLRIGDIGRATSLLVDGLGLSIRERIDLTIRGGVTTLFIGDADASGTRLLELSHYRAHPEAHEPGNGHLHTDIHLADAASALLRLKQMGFRIDGAIASDGEGHRFRIVDQAAQD